MFMAKKQKRKILLDDSRQQNENQTKAKRKHAKNNAKNVD